MRSRVDRLTDSNHHFIPCNLIALLLLYFLLYLLHFASFYLSFLSSSFEYARLSIFLLRCHETTCY